MEKSQRTLSRRGFLASAGVLIGVAGMASVASGAKPAFAGEAEVSGNSDVDPLPAVDAPAEWTDVADVVVVGTGGSGAAAIVAALEAGAKVIAIEKNDIWGGHMQFSTGRAFGGLSTVEASYASEISAPHPYAEKDPAVCRAIAEAGDADFEWLAGMLAESGIVVTTGMNFPLVALCAPGDYVQPEDTGVLEGNAWYQWFPYNARGYSMALQNRAKALGVDVRYSTAVTALVSDGEGVVGVKAVDGEGAELFVKGAVVLCTGGYSANDAMLRHYLPESRYNEFHKYAGFASATGDGVRMAQGVGATVVAMDQVEVWHGGVLDPEYRNGPASFYSPANQLSRMPGLCVNKLGNRYMDESRILGDLYGYQGKIRAQQLDNESYTIVDSTTITADDLFNTFHPVVCEVPAPWFNEDIQDQIDRGIVVKADTIEELAEKLGLDPTAVAATVGRYNEICVAGVDADFFKPAIYLHPVKEAPFYGVKEKGGQLINTWGGLKISPTGQVLDGGWQPIDGLYAAGEVCAFGGELHRVMSMGRISGTQAAGYALGK